MRRRSLILAIVVAFLLGAAPVPAAHTADCEFVLGFATLHALIRDVVGDCIVDEHYNPTNGDGLQETTNGLLVWRKADNFTAFTDGFSTWVNGPLGLQQRLNNQRFWWESNPGNLPIIPAPVAGDRCHTADLSLSLDPPGVNGAAGSETARFRLTNNLNVSCTFDGYAGAQMLDVQNNAVPTQVVRGRGNGFIFPDPAAAPIVVPAGGSAVFYAGWSGNVSFGPCPTAAQLAVTPPDEYAPLVVAVQMAPCLNGTIYVSAIQAAA